MIFDAYVPTRTSHSVEVRVRSDSRGPVRLSIAGSSVTLPAPSISHRSRHFFCHRFDGLPPATALRLEAIDEATSSRQSVDTATLPTPLGACRLKLGLVADLHLSLEEASIDDYGPGDKRLYGLGFELGAKYVRRLESLGADAIVLLGDNVDPCNERTLARLRELLGPLRIPIYPIIGNHEPWSQGGRELFYAGCGLPNHGYYAVTLGSVRLLLLDTPAPDALLVGSAQYRWLEAELEASSGLDVVLFSHFSLLLHPCVSGHRNDGYQLLEQHAALRSLLGRYPNVRVFSAGHKNVPSKVVTDGVVHLLSPQLIQAPCAYDLLELYEGGVCRTTFELDEQHYVEVARAAYAHDWSMRFGAEDGRNFWYGYRTPSGVRGTHTWPCPGQPGC